MSCHEGSLGVERGASTSSSETVRQPLSALLKAISGAE